MAQITDLPVELLLQIFGCWGDSVKELSALSRCSRLLHWLAFDHLFTKAFQSRCEVDTLRRISMMLERDTPRHAFQSRCERDTPCQVFMRLERDKPRHVFMKLVFHAIKCDSQHIARWLCYHELSKELNGFIPSDSKLTNTITYLHLAIIGDAPSVANHLVRYGTDVWEGGGDYPDITPLYLAIANPRGTGNLDSALRIACSYALPKTCRYLLTRGADPNSLSRFGLAAIHLAVRKRLPWRNFEVLRRLVHGEDSSSSGWETSLIRTAAALLRFGADPNLRSDTSREHPCGHKCWLSPDCEHRGQAVLHYACSGAPTEVVSLLLKHGADPKAANDDGYLPLFSALCQDHNGVAMQLLQNELDPTNLIIIQPYQSTALHIACRFACVEVVSFLLERGADANATDVVGATPLHELLGQRCMQLEGRVLEILPLLDTYGAVAEIRAQGVPTARQIAKVHPSSRVRQFFDPAVIDHRGSEHFKAQHSTWSEQSIVSRSIFQRIKPQEDVPPESLGIYNCESFPFLSSLPPGQDGVKEAPTPDSAWLEKKKTARLRLPPTPAPKQRNRQKSGPPPKGETGPVAGWDDGEMPLPGLRSQDKPRMSESAKFWGTMASSGQKANHQKVEQAREERKENKRDGVVSRRGKRGSKWAPLDLS